jgi:ribosome recycling factor
MKKKWSRRAHRCHCAAERERIVREVRHHTSKEIKKAEEKIVDRVKKLEKDIEAIWRGLAQGE